jgi:hypothetical protein
MPITSIKRDSNSNVSIVRMISTDTLSAIASANYIKNQMTVIKGLNDGNWQWFTSDVILCAASDANGFFQFSDATFSTLVLIASDTDGTVTPGLSNQIAIYPTNGTVISGVSILPSLVQANPVNFNNGIGATANKFYAGDGSWKTVSSVTNHSIHTIFVAQDGNDITGNGSINSPYATISHAIAVTTTANLLNIFNIFCLYGIFNETSLTLKPFISINGAGSILNITNDIDLDTSWGSLTPSGGKITVEGFQSVTVGGNINLDFSVAGPRPCTFNLFDFNIGSLLGTFTITSSGYLTSNIYRSSIQYITIYNSNGYISQSSIANLTFNAPIGLTSTSFNLLDSNISGDASFNGDSIALSSTIKIYNTKIGGSLSADQSNVTLNVDSNSLDVNSLPVLTNGATVNYINPSNSLFANYTPVNYTPDSTGGTSPSSSVAAHLHGLDNAFNDVIFNWTDVTGTTQNASVSNGYVSNNAASPVTINLPAIASFGQMISIQGNAFGGFVVVANTGQIIHVDIDATSAGGTISSTGRYQSLDLICTEANTTWVARNFIGTFLYT